jgi:hypothetical protein
VMKSEKYESMCDELDQSFTCVRDLIVSCHSDHHFGTHQSADSALTLIDKGSCVR